MKPTVKNGGGKREIEGLPKVPWLRGKRPLKVFCREATVFGNEGFFQRRLVKRLQKDHRGFLGLENMHNVYGENTYQWSCGSKIVNGFLQTKTATDRLGRKNLRE